MPAPKTPIRKRLIDRHPPQIDFRPLRKTRRAIFVEI